MIPGGHCPFEYEKQTSAPALPGPLTKHEPTRCWFNGPDSISCARRIWYDRRPSQPAYRILDGQEIVAPTAAERKGVQLVVTLEANGGDRGEIRVGRQVRLVTRLRFLQAGSVVALKWDFDGKRAFPARSPVRQGIERATVTITHRFDKPSTYFPRCATFRPWLEDTRTSHARISLV